MKVLTVRNVHEALPKGIRLLQQEGIQRDSRNGPVLVMPCPVTTVYEKPCERVIFWPERDANPFFHLYESLWMLAGRNDVAPLLKYAKRMIDFSDDGKILHGAYGYRWRKWFADWSFPPDNDLNPRRDQLYLIATELKNTSDSRRCVLQMWDGQYDLGRSGKDVPCNTIATFQRDSEGKLDLTVFCRSNDIIWGAYGANAIHFSMLLEYMALWIECPVGKYYQISVNYHAYLNTLESVKFLPGKVDMAGHASNPYLDKQVSVLEMAKDIEKYSADEDNNIQRIDVGYILEHSDSEDMILHNRPPYLTSPWANMVYTVLEAHEIYRKFKGEEKYTKSLKQLHHTHECDWVIAAREWIQRRYDIWKVKNMLSGEITHP